MPEIPLTTSNNERTRRGRERKDRRFLAEHASVQTPFSLSSICNMRGKVKEKPPASSPLFARQFFTALNFFRFQSPLCRANIVARSTKEAERMRTKISLLKVRFCSWAGLRIKWSETSAISQFARTMNRKRN